MSKPSQKNSVPAKTATKTRVPAAPKKKIKALLSPAPRPAKKPAAAQLKSAKTKAARPKAAKEPDTTTDAKAKAALIAAEPTEPAPDPRKSVKTRIRSSRWCDSNVGPHYCRNNF